MRKHLLNFSAVAALAAGLTLAATQSGCQKKVEPPEPIPAAAPLPLNSFVRSWAFNLGLEGGDVVKEIHPREKDVYVYTRGGQILVMARDTGRLEWEARIRSTDRGGMKPPVVLKERVVIPTSSTFEVYDTNDGHFVKSVPLKVAARSNAIGLGTLVYIGGDFANSSRLVALDISKDYVPTVWQLMIPRGGLASTPALLDDVLFIGGGDGNVYAVNAISREPLWPLKDNAFKTEGPIVADVAADETGVYVPSTDSRMYCLNKGTGKLKWQFYAGRALTEGVILSATQAYLPIPNLGIAAFSKGDGEFNRKPLWIATDMNQFLSEDEKFVYLRRAADNVIVAFDKATGEQQFENKRRDLVTFATNTKSDGVIFAVSKTSRLLAIKPVLKPGVIGELVLDDVSDAPLKPATFAMISR
jgi:outer membrane protein assembly factor BamB